MRPKQHGVTQGWRRFFWAVHSWYESRTMSRSLRQRLRGALPQAQYEALANVDDLDDRLREFAASAAARNLVVDDEVLAEALAGALREGVALDELQAADLYLAAACGHGDTAALRCFEAEYGGEFDRAIAKSPTLGLAPAEFRQLVLDRLFVAEGDAAPRIRKYLGRGSLKAWLRVMTSRFIIDLSRRRDRRTASDDGLAEKIGAVEDTELDYLRHAYGPALDSAFAQAVAALSVRERNLLRQRYLHEVSPDTLAKMYGVHRSTVFAWLDKARVSLLGQVRQGLAAQLPGDKLESVVGMLGSKLQLSVRRMLNSKLEPEKP